MVELLTQSKTTTALADLSSLSAQLAQGDLGVRMDEGFLDPGLIDVQRYAEFPAHATDHMDLEGRAVDRASSFPATKLDTFLRTRVTVREHSEVTERLHPGKTPYGNIRPSGRGSLVYQLS